MDRARADDPAPQATPGAGGCRGSRTVTVVPAAGGLDVHPAAVPVDDRLGDREAETRTLDLLLLRDRGPEEPGEQPVLLVERDPAAGIGHRQRHPVLVVGRGDPDPAAVGGELHGVREQVADHPLELGAVAVDHAEVVRHLDRDVEHPPLEQRADRGARVGDHRAEVDRREVEPERAGVHAGQGEQVTDQQLEALGVPVDHRERLHLVRGQLAERLLQQHLEVAGDAGQRRAQLVGDGRDELGLRQVELTQPVHRRLLVGVDPGLGDRGAELAGQPLGDRHVPLGPGPGLRGLQLQPPDQLLADQDGRRGAGALPAAGRRPACELRGRVAERRPRRAVAPGPGAGPPGRGGRAVAGGQAHRARVGAERLAEPSGGALEQPVEVELAAHLAGELGDGAGLVGPALDLGLRALEVLHGLEQLGGGALADLLRGTARAPLTLEPALQQGDARGQVSGRRLLHRLPRRRARRCRSARSGPRRAACRRRG